MKRLEDRWDRLPEVSDAEVCAAIRKVPKHFSANLVVDLANTVDYFPSLVVVSGAGVGQIVDLLNANAHCNVFVAGVANSGSVPFLLQTSDTTNSGDFTDPTSGLPANVFTSFGNKIASGGIFHANSGLYASGNSSPCQAAVTGVPLFQSGNIDFAAFQRPHRYARLNTLSGNAALLTAGFVSQKKTTGSGAGYSQSPQAAAAINV